MSIIDDIKNLYNKFVWNNTQQTQPTVIPDFSNITEATPNLSPVVAPQLDFSQIPQQPVIDFSNITEATPNLQPFVAPQIEIADLPWFTTPTTQLDLSPVISQTNQVELKPLEPIELPQQQTIQQQVPTTGIQQTEPFLQTPVQTEEIQSIDTWESLNPFTTESVKQSKSDIIDKISWLSKYAPSLLIPWWAIAAWTLSVWKKIADVTWITDLASRAVTWLKDVWTQLAENASINEEIWNTLNVWWETKPSVLWWIIWWFIPWWQVLWALSPYIADWYEKIFPWEEVTLNKGALVSSKWEYSQYFSAVKNSLENQIRKDSGKEEYKPMSYEDYKRVYNNSKPVFEKQQARALEQEKQNEAVLIKSGLSQAKNESNKRIEKLEEETLKKYLWDLSVAQNRYIMKWKLNEDNSNVEVLLSSILNSAEKAKWWLKIFWESDAISTLESRAKNIVKAQYENSPEIAQWKLEWKLEWKAWEEFLKQKILEKYWISEQDFIEAWFKQWEFKLTIWELVNWYAKGSSNPLDYNSRSPEEELRIINWDLLWLSYRPWLNVAKWFNLLLPVTTRLAIAWDEWFDFLTSILWWWVHALKSLAPWDQNFRWLFRWDSSLIRETSLWYLAYAKSNERAKREWPVTNWLRNATLAFDDVSGNLLTAVAEVFITNWAAWLLKVWSIANKIWPMQRMMVSLWAKADKAADISMMWYKIWNRIWTPIVSEIAIENALLWLDPQAWTQFSEDLINITLPLWILLETVWPAVTMLRRANNWATWTAFEILKDFRAKSIDKWWDIIDLWVIDALEESYERAKSALKKAWKDDEQIWQLDTYLKWLFANWVINQQLFSTAFKEWVLTKSLIDEAFTLWKTDAIKKVDEILQETSKWIESIETFEAMKSIVDDSTIPFYDVLATFVPWAWAKRFLSITDSTLTEPLPRNVMYKISPQTAQYFPAKKRITTKELYTESEVEEIVKWVWNWVTKEDNFIKVEWWYRLNPENMSQLWIEKRSLSIDDIKTIATNKESVELLEKTIASWWNLVITKEQLELLSATWTIGRIESVLSKVFC